MSLYKLKEFKTLIMVCKLICFFILLSYACSSFSQSYQNFDQQIIDPEAPRPINASIYLSLLNSIKSINKTAIINGSINSEYLNNYFYKLPSKKCEKLLNNFKKSLYDFIECSLLSSIPYQVCMSCSSYYELINFQYENLIKPNNKSGCPNQVLNSEKMQLIHNYYRLTTTQWNTYNCHSKPNVKFFN